MTEDGHWIVIKEEEEKANGKMELKVDEYGLTLWLPPEDDEDDEPFYFV